MELGSIATEQTNNYKDKLQLQNFIYSNATTWGQQLEGIH